MSPFKEIAAISLVVGIILTRRYYKEWIVPASAVALPWPGKAVEYLTPDWL
jgi:hypothetical protein